MTTATYDPAGRQLSQTDPDGHTTTWTYDTAGREATTSFDGKLLAAVERDLVRRRVVITAGWRKGYRTFQGGRKVKGIHIP